MSYVKLTARPDTWFKAGTEVYHYDEDRRLTFTEWVEAKTAWGHEPFVVCVRGTRVVEAGYEEKLFGPPGTERSDGECCGSDEFDVESVEEPR